MKIKSVYEQKNALKGWLGEEAVGHTAVAKWRVLGADELEVQMRLSDGAYNSLAAANTGAFLNTPRGRLAVSVGFDDSAEILANKMRGAILNLMTNVMTTHKDFWFGASAQKLAASFVDIYAEMAGTSVYNASASKIFNTALSSAKE